MWLLSSVSNIITAFFHFKLIIHFCMYFISFTFSTFQYLRLIAEYF
nr:MAG TPA: hypothetical protein [Caudoviricetes sp.]